MHLHNTRQLHMHTSATLCCKDSIAYYHNHCNCLLVISGSSFGLRTCSIDSYSKAIKAKTKHLATKLLLYAARYHWPETSPCFPKNQALWISKVMILKLCQPHRWKVMPGGLDQSLPDKLLDMTALSKANEIVLVLVLERHHWHCPGEDTSATLRS